MNQLSFFGLNEYPFRLTPDRDFYFPSAEQCAIAEVVKYGLEQGEGFLAVTGEVGSGKTMLIRYLTSALFCKYETAMVISPQLSPLELVQAIIRDTGLEPDPQASLEQLLHSLNKYLSSLAEKDKRLVVVIDEAQDLPPESLEQLRLLSNFETDKQKWLQILLVGQPELKDIISSSKLRQLNQRITITETLHPLSALETKEYISFRLSRAGRSDMLPSASFIKNIFQYSGGIPRLINKLMTRTMLIMYGEKKHSFDKKSLREAAQSLGMTKPRKKIFFSVMPCTAALMLFIFVMQYI